MRRPLVLGTLAVLGLAAGALALWPTVGRALAWRAVERQIAAAHPEVREVPADTLAAWLASPDPPLVLDARAPEEFAASHLPGARRVDPDADAAALREIVGDRPDGRPVVVYCSVGWRSAGVAARLAGAGVPALNLGDGSGFGWANAGRPLVRGGERAERFHPYSAAWGRLLRAERRATDTPPGGGPP